MVDSLSIIVPVHNSQSLLARQVDRLLDLLTDLTTDFQVVLVDDGSTDATAEVADELSRQYPQVTLVPGGRQRDQRAAMAAGLRRATGRYVFVHPMEDALPTEQLTRFWASRHQPAPAASQGEPKPWSAGLLSGLDAWGQELREAASERGGQCGIPTPQERTDASKPSPGPPTPAAARVPIRPKSGRKSPAMASDSQLERSLRTLYS